MKMGLSSSKLWPGLGKPEGARHEAQGCRKTFFVWGSPGSVADSGAFGSGGGCIQWP